MHVRIGANNPNAHEQQDNGDAEATNKSCTTRGTTDSFTESTQTRYWLLLRVSQRKKAMLG